MECQFCVALDSKCLLTHNSLNRTPLFQVVNHALPNPENKTKFTLVFSNATEKDILMKSELDGLAKKYPNTFKIIYTVDKPETGSWTGPLPLSCVLPSH